ncbi:MAG TPA: hybrid sensor histidine kinase/response regulator, partial [Desulfatirhabdiaceae bacterium]|nr:hybrid sensor histidine kinase/response regulator [Desulfatirhabdiaceae bacterium]
LKNDPVTRDIPVLFITVLIDGADESRGLSLGAVDYITKPFHPSVVPARVKTHLRLKHALTTLAGRNKELEAMVRLRESVTRMVGSDFKRPLSGIISLSTRLVKTPDLSESVFSDLKTIEDMGFQLLKMISQSLDLWKLERGVYRVEPEPVDIPSIISMGLMETDSLSKARNIPVALLVNGLPADPDDRFMISGEMLLCYCMITNLMKNAIEASPPGKTVTIDLRQTAGDSQIHIHNHGVIPIEIRSRFFEKGVTYGKTGAAGLGVYTARLMAEAMGGSLNLKTGDDMDTILTIQLPSA